MALKLTNVKPENNLELLTPECWDYRGMLLCLVCISARTQTQSFVHAKQALYTLSYNLSDFELLILLPPLPKGWDSR